MKRFEKRFAAISSKKSSKIQTGRSNGTKKEPWNAMSFENGALIPIEMEARKIATLIQNLDRPMDLFLVNKRINTTRKHDAQFF